MYMLTVKIVRPSTDVDFHSVTGDDAESVNFRKHWAATYKSTGKLLYVNHEMSEDQLTQTTTFLWDSEESCNEAWADPVFVAMRESRKAYHDANGITISEKVGEVL